MGKGTLHCTHDIVHLRGLWQMIAIRVGRSQGVHQPENTGAVYMGINWTMFGGISAINERVLNVWMKMSYKRQSSPWDAWAASKICTVTTIHCHLTATGGAKGASSYQRVSTNCVSGYLCCVGHVSREASDAMRWKSTNRLWSQWTVWTQHWKRIHGTAITSQTGHPSQP